MSHDLNASLALAKQYLDELFRIAPLDALTRRQYGTGTVRQRVEFLLGKLDGLTRTIERHFSIEEPTDHPIITLNPGHLSFYKDMLSPNIEALRTAYLDVSGFAELDALLRGVEPSKGYPLLSTISWGVERWLTSLDEGENEAWLERGFDLESAFDLVEARWFRPDDWMENLRMLKPVLLDRPTYKIRDHVKYRLTEIYGTFMFGLWMASIALCRSVVEFSIIDNASRLKIETKRQNARGEMQDKRLSDLISDLATSRVELRVPLEAVRDTGNRILHPKKRDVIAFPKVMRGEALDCIKHTKYVIEALYTDATYEAKDG